MISSEYLEVHQKISVRPSLRLHLYLGLNVVTLRMVTDKGIEQSGFDLKFTTIRSKQYFRSVCSAALEINRAAVDWS
jgi:hypothetical protein